jgi:hypothetical protein
MIKKTQKQKHEYLHKVLQSCNRATQIHTFLDWVIDLEFKDIIDRDSYTYYKRLSDEQKYLFYKKNKINMPY